MLEVVAPMMGLAFLLTACSGEDPPSIDVSGSSTVEPISTRVAELFVDAGNSVDITVDGPGTGDGFQIFCTGETDVSDASRRIAAGEVADCEANGIEFTELKVAFDGLTVLTNAENTAIDCLSFADLYALVGPESEGFDDWSDAMALAAELGSSTSFPDASLHITAPGPESGTYDTFIEIVLANIGETRVDVGALSEDEADVTRSDYTSQSNDNATLQAIEGSPSSFGWVGFAFAEEAGDQVKTIAISEEPGGECIMPTETTIADGTYPLSRSLYIYVNKAAAESNAALRDYVDFYLGDGYSAVEQVGYVPLPANELGQTNEVWTAMTVATRGGGT